MGAEIKLEVKNISKSFPGVKALDQVSFALKKGTVHVLCGENGAGKSTLMKVLDGIYRQDEGEIYIDGKKVEIHSPMDARANGIAMIFQELSYVPDLTIAENIFMGRWAPKGKFRLNWNKMYDETERLMKQEGLPYKAHDLLRSLSVADIQLIEILKAVSFEAKILIMDEPTSSISNKDVEFLFRKIEELKKRGVSIIYISHKMDEIFRIADEITVLRDGTTIATKKANETTMDEIISLMVGRKLENMYPKEDVKIGEEIFRVEKLTSHKIFEDISFQVHRGEVVGFAGLVGAGRTEIMRAIFGLDKYQTGEIYLRGQKIQIKSPADAIEKGIAMISEDRRKYGIIPMRDIMENVSLASLKQYFYKGIRHKKREEREVEQVCKKMRVKTPSIEAKIMNLSGGNQQKVILAKWLLCDPEVLIMDEPTRGIDVGAKTEIYQLIEEFANAGKGIILVSSELPELIGMCDRIYVMNEGHIAGSLERKEFTQEVILGMAVSN